jgi:hypothetical protein
MYIKACEKVSAGMGGAQSHVRVMGWKLSTEAQLA